MRFASLLIIATLLIGAGANAEDDRQRSARDDLERQLKAMVGTPPTKLRVGYVALDEPNMKVTEASFELDGSALPAPSLSKLNTDGEHAIFVGDIEPGQHVLVSKLVVENTASPVINSEGGMKWPITLNIRFDSLPGIEVAYQVKPARNTEVSDMKQRFTMTAPHSLRMLAKLDDGTMPEPMKRKIEAVETPVTVAPVEQNRGSSVASAEQRKAAQEAKAEKAQAAKEAKAEKAQAAKEAREAKAQAAAEAKEAKARATQEKQDRAAGKRTAMVEELRSPPPVMAQAPVAAPVPVPPPPAPVELDAGQPMAVDAGSVKQALPPVQAQSAEEKGLPMPLLIGGGVVLLGIIIALASRRKKG